MTTEFITRVAISLEVDHEPHTCRELAIPLLAQLASGRYDRCSVLPIPASTEEWEVAHRTARKRATRAEARGYTVRQVNREEHEDDIYAINRSLTHRQGRPMADAYLERPSFSPLPDYPCARHRIRTWGVFTSSQRLVGYLTLYRAGDLVLVSQILGHGTYLDDEIMYLLFSVALRAQTGNPGVVVYNRHDSGTDGLRFFKERLGFREEHVEWLP
jgi:hypothetical protein